MLRARRFVLVLLLVLAAGLSVVAQVAAHPGKEVPQVPESVPAGPARQEEAVEVYLPPRQDVLESSGTSVEAVEAVDAVRPRASPSPWIDLRRRLGEASGVGRRARAGEPAAVAEVKRRVASEPDPRVRQALTTGEMPDLGRAGRSNRRQPELPAPAKPAEAGTQDVYWLTPGSVDGTYQSRLEIDDRGQAIVDTVFESADGDRWHVRYPGWAWRDSAGKLVIDGRGQQVEYLERPPWGQWSPDSMLIGHDGLIDLIDDKHDTGQGTNGGRGPG